MLGTIEEEHDGFTKTLLEAGDGIDEYGTVVGRPSMGDWVKIHYKGRVVSTGQEFEDTYHRQKPTHFQIGGPYWLTDIKPTWNRGLVKAAQTMTLGDKCRLEIKSKFAYGARGTKSEYGEVPPNEDIVLECELVEINGHSSQQKEGWISCSTTTWNICGVIY